MISSSKYNILIMRDDSTVKRYRLHPVWLKFALYSLLLLLTVAGVCGFMSFTFWQKNRVLTEAYQEATRKVSENASKLERLQIVEQLLNSRASERLNASAPAPASFSASPELNNSAATLNLDSLFQYVDLKRVRVGNLQARTTDDNVRITFSLSNLQSNKTLIGNTELELITVDGKLAKTVRNPNLSFQIQRFRQLSATIPFSNGLTAANLFGIRIVITVNTGEVIFSQTYPVDYIGE